MVQSTRAPAGAEPSQRPLLKWVGGKRQLLGAILARLPERIDTYYEPFVGGGAVFFALAQQRRFRRAVLADSNAELIATYRAVQRDVDAVIASLGRLRHSEEEYYRIRASRPRSEAARAARMIYLNRTGFNGLYRVNRRGEFNVPFGRYQNPRICDAEHLRSVAVALAGVELLVGDFAGVAERARAGDAVYLDPPYVPVSATARFAEYHERPFGPDEHRRLAEVFGALWRRGVVAVLSNSDTELTRALYRAFEVEVVAARRSVNSRASARGPVLELLAFAAPRGPARTRATRAPVPLALESAVGE
jgi:DNA adenine methylase